MTYRVLSLFAGIGGFDLGLERTGGFRTVAFCEIEPFAQSILRKHWPEVPIYDDVRELTAEQLAADGINPNVIVGGFPCQDVSYAGAGAGLSGERSGLWSEIVRLVSEIRPEYLVVENVSALLDRGLGDVLRDLATIGCDAEWHCIPASYAGLSHIRDRVWIIAYPERVGRQASPLFNRLIEEARRKASVGQPRRVDGPAAWAETIASLGREDDGLPSDVDRLRCLGNAVVPQIPEIIGQAILAVQAIEAGTDATTKIGAAEGESAVPQGCTRRRAA